MAQIHLLKVIVVAIITGLVSAQNSKIITKEIITENAFGDRDGNNKDGSCTLCLKMFNEIIEDMIKTSISLNTKDKYGMTALMFAAEKGQTRNVEDLINVERPLDLNLQDNEGFSALHHAVSNGHSEIVKLLLKANADIKLKSKTDETVSMMASLHDLTDIILLLKEYDEGELIHTSL